jgi:hypothetical protein
MAEVTISPDLLLNEIVKAAGGDPKLSRYRQPVLDVPDVTQVALDAAVAAYDPVVAADAVAEEEFTKAETTKMLKFIEAITFNHENRIRTLEGQPTRTPQEFRNILKGIYKAL